MQDIYKDLMLLEDEQEEETKDLILDTLNSLTHFYVEDEDGSRKVPWYCMLDSIASDYGYSEKEMSDFAQKNGFIVFKISPIGSFEGGLAIADKDVDFETVKENIKKSVIDDFEEEKDIPEVKISFKDKKESLNEENCYDCFINDIGYIGQVKAKNKEDAYNKMKKTWLNYPYDKYDGYAYVELSKNCKESIKEEFESVPEEDLQRLENTLKENGFKIVSKQPYRGDTSYHYQIITNEGNQTEDSFNDYVDFIEETLDEFEDETGAPCTFNMGLQVDGYISCGFDVRGVYYEPGEDIKFKKPISIRFRNGKPADEYTKNQLKDIGSHLGIKDDEIIDFIPVDKPKNESLEDRYTYLQYENLPIKVYGRVHSASDLEPSWAEELEVEEDFELEVETNEILEALEYIEEDKDEEYIREHFDELFDKHEEEIKEMFKDRAKEEASEYFADKYYELHNFPYYDESLKEDANDEIIEETNEYKIVKTNSISYKSKNGVATGKPIKKEIYQVYFRTQDFNPSVNRWMNKGWSLQLTDFKSLEDARAFVKKYGKTLKNELESLKEDKEDYKEKFDERTHAHIDRVNKYAKKINKEYPNHDNDKFNELYDGYSLMSKENVNEEEQALIDDATFRHVRDNEHHCEHWVDEKDIEGFSRNNPNPHGCLDCSKMPNEALEEMCCDWCAMSEEFNNTPFEWYEKNKDTRWHFNEEQDKFILDTLHKLWDEDIDNSTRDVYNSVEEDKMKKKLIEAEQKDKEFDKEFEKYANKPLSSEEFHTLMKKMGEFYE